MCVSLAKQAGVGCSPEVPGHMLLSDKRPGLALWSPGDTANDLINVITSDTAVPFDFCPRLVIAMRCLLYEIWGVKT